MTLPDGWRMAKLEDLAQSPRSIVDGPFGSNLARRHYTEYGPRVVRLQNIGEGRFLDAEAHISKEHFESLRKHEVIAGDLLVASLGDPVLRACLAPASLGDAIVKADCIRVRLNAAVDSRFVLYALENEPTKRWAAAHSHGVGRMRLGLKVIRGIPIALPPIDEQRRIVEILEEHLSTVDAASRMLEASRRRLVLLRRTTIASRFRADEVPVPLAELLVSSIGGIWGSEPGTDDVDVDVYRVTELQEFGTLRPSQTRRAISRKQLESRRLQSGDLLLEKSGGGPNTPVGRVGLVGEHFEESVCANFMQLMRPRQGVVRPRYLHILLNDFHDRGGTRVMQKASTNIRNIKASEYLKVPFAIGAMPEQDAAISAVEEVTAQIVKIRGEMDAAVRYSRALRRALLRSACSGQLTGHVSDLHRAEELVS